MVTSTLKKPVSCQELRSVRRHKEVERYNGTFAEPQSASVVVHLVSQNAVDSTIILLYYYINNNYNEYDF